MPRICVLLALLFAGAIEDIRAETGEPEGTVVTLGKISDDPRRDLLVLQPLIDYVEAGLGPHGVARVEVAMAREPSQMVSYLRQGRVSWVTETLGMGIILSEQAGARIVMNRWKYGEREYRATLFVRDDSPARTIDDIRGLKVGFEHPGSTTGFMVPALEIHRRGLALVPMGSPREEFPEEVTGYFYTGDEINTSTWVFKRLVDVGAVSSTDWTRSFQVPDAFQGQLRIIHSSDPLPRAVEIFSADFDPALGERLIELLTMAHENDVGRAALDRFQGTTRFERFEPEQWPYVRVMQEELGPMLDEVR